MRGERETRTHREREEAERREAARAALEQERRWLAADLWEGRVRPRCKICGARRENALLRRCLYCGTREGERT